MAEQGYNEKEIATALELNKHTVRNTLRQPSARQHMIETMQQDVSTEIKRFLEGTVLPSLRVLEEIALNPECRASDRIAAANSLADRQMGRPNQPFTHNPVNGKSVASMSVAELDAALAATGFVAPSAPDSVSEAKP